MTRRLAVTRCADGSANSFPFRILRIAQAIRSGMALDETSCRHRMGQMVP